ncbi:MAG: ABC transporter substrate-binding protein [Myxococcales bacterium]
MKRGLDLLNGAGFAAALALAIYGGSMSTGRGMPDAKLTIELDPHIKPETLPDGSQVLRDAHGVAVPLKHYERIASQTMIADRVLSDLCEPTRIVAFTSHGATQSVIAHRLAGKEQLASRAPVETVLKLKPDLLLVNNLVDPGYVAHLREHGIPVFDLGHMQGLQTLLPNIRAIGYLIGAPERAEQYARHLRERLERVASDRAGKPRPRAIYISIYGDRMYGGAARTSYHEILEYAGLSDAAAEAGLDGWPELINERILSLDPEVIVTQTNMGAVICRHAGLAGLKPCQGAGKIIELPMQFLEDPGPSILDTTEMLYDALWREP